MTTIDKRQVFHVASSDNISWDAVYTSKECIVESRPLNGWVLIGIVKPGQKHPTPEIHGLHNVVGNDYIITGTERQVLGYCRRDQDALKLFGKAARTLLKKLARQAQPAKGVRP